MNNFEVMENGLCVLGDKIFNFRGQTPWIITVAYVGNDHVTRPGNLALLESSANVEVALQSCIENLIGCGYNVPHWLADYQFIRLGTIAGARRSFSLRHTFGLITGRISPFSFGGYQFSRGNILIIPSDIFNERANFYPTNQYMTELIEAMFYYLSKIKLSNKNCWR